MLRLVLKMCLYGSRPFGLGQWYGTASKDSPGDKQGYKLVKSGDMLSSVQLQIDVQVGSFTFVLKPLRVPLSRPFGSFVPFKLNNTK